LSPREQMSAIQLLRRWQQLFQQLGGEPTIEAVSQVMTELLDLADATDEFLGPAATVATRGGAA
jgi:hypothetical protein